MDDLQELHRDAEASTLALDVAQQLEALLGLDNIYTLMAWNSYGSALCNDHREQAGLDALQRVDAARRRIFPPGDRYIHTTEVGIGICLMRMKRYPEAQSELQSAVKGLEAARGPAYRRTQQAYAALRDLYGMTGRPDEARQMAAKVSGGDSAGSAASP